MRSPIRGVTLLAAALGAGLAAPVSAQSSADRLSVHGFLSQAYAVTSDVPQYGVPTEGTTDYRSAALQFRYDIGSGQDMVVQFSHRRVANALVGELDADVELDWAFFRKRFGGTSVRVGKVPMPRGLFNEIRDVGVLLPFYRASKAVYSEGVETVNGVVVDRSFDVGPFGLDASAFTGGFDVKVELVDQNGPNVTESELGRSIGGQLVLRTPLRGLRFGASFSDASYETSDEDWLLWVLSGDLTRERFYLRGEIEQAEVPGFVYDAWYTQAGVNLFGGVWLNAQVEANTNTIDVAPGFELELDAIEDYALGLTWQVNPALVLKAEAHTFEGYQVDAAVDVTGRPVENEYFILSVATAF